MNAAEMLRQRLAELAAAFALLTRLPVHRLSLPRVTVPAEAVWAYPVVGAAVGAIGGAVYWITHSLSCPPALAALCALVAMILATGALHEDGLADFADGLAGDTKERSLSIMRDHQIGTFGVIALMLSLAMRTTAITLIAEPRAVMAALIAADAASRLSAVLIMAALPPGAARRPVGIGRQSHCGARGDRARGDLRHRLAAFALWRCTAVDRERGRQRHRPRPRRLATARRPDRRRARR